MEKIKQLGEIGTTKLPDNGREMILTAFNTYPTRWFTANMLAVPLELSLNYTYKICESLSMNRIVEKRGVGKKTYYRYRKEELVGR